jgi:hypothetical protein
MPRANRFIPNHIPNNLNAMAIWTESGIKLYSYKTQITDFLFLIIFMYKRTGLQITVEGQQCYILGKTISSLIIFTSKQ